MWSFSKMAKWQSFDKNNNSWSINQRRKLVSRGCFLTMKNKYESQFSLEEMDGRARCASRAFRPTSSQSKLVETLPANLPGVNKFREGFVSRVFQKKIPKKLWKNDDSGLQFISSNLWLQFKKSFHQSPAHHIWRILEILIFLKFEEVPEEGERAAMILAPNEIWSMAVHSFDTFGTFGRLRVRYYCSSWRCASHRILSWRSRTVRRGCRKRSIRGDLVSLRGVNIT